MTLRELRLSAGLRQMDIISTYLDGYMDAPLYSKIERGIVPPPEPFVRHVYTMCGQAVAAAEKSSLEALASGAITAECRADSYASMDTATRRRAVLRLLEDGPATARELAYKLGYRERNAVAPRLTELCDKGLVEPIGKRTCTVTGKTVTVWAITEDGRDANRPKN